MHHPDDADDREWEAWRSLYGSVVSSLAGPRGDAGFGVEEATVIGHRSGYLPDLGH